jgi:hypothetical protein
MLALAAALVAVVLRLARARGGLEWTAVALFCATVVAVLAERLGYVHAGHPLLPGSGGGGWFARIAGDLLLVGGLLSLARSRPGALRAIALPMALLGYVLRQPTLVGAVGWAVSTAVWVAGAWRGFVPRR